MEESFLKKRKLKGKESPSHQAAVIPTIAPRDRYCHHRLAHKETEPATCPRPLGCYIVKVDTNPALPSSEVWAQWPTALANIGTEACPQIWSEMRKWSQRWLGYCQQGLSLLLLERIKGVSPLFLRNENSGETSRCGQAAATVGPKPTGRTGEPHLQKKAGPPMSA